jgi:hypothetical protein
MFTFMFVFIMITFRIRWYHVTNFQMTFGTLHYVNLAGLFRVPTISHVHLILRLPFLRLIIIEHPIMQLALMTGLPIMTDRTILVEFLVSAKLSITAQVTANLSRTAKSLILHPLIRTYKADFAAS